MPEYTLQPARTADAVRIAAMSRDLIEAGLRPRWSAARVTWHIRHANSMVLVARRSDITAGFAIMSFGDDVAHLNLLAVDPAHRRRGVAAALLAWLEETALTAGTFVICLEVRAGNEPARAFYSAMAYREVGRVSGYYQGVESAIRMERDVRTGRGAVPGNNGNRNINPA